MVDYLYVLNTLVENRCPGDDREFLEPYSR